MGKHSRSHGAVWGCLWKQSLNVWAGWDCGEAFEECVGNVGKRS